MDRVGDGIGQVSRSGSFHKLPGAKGWSDMYGPDTFFLGPRPRRSQANKRSKKADLTQLSVSYKRFLDFRTSLGKPQIDAAFD